MNTQECIESGMTIAETMRYWENESECRIVLTGKDGKALVTYFWDNCDVWDTLCVAADHFAYFPHAWEQEILPVIDTVTCYNTKKRDKHGRQAVMWTLTGDAFRIYVESQHNTYLARGLISK